MPPQLRLFIWNTENYLRLDTDDPSKCVFVGSNNVYTGIQSCAYRLHGVCLFVEPDEFLKENETLFNQLSDSRKTTPANFHLKDMRITIMLNGKSVKDGDLYIYFKNVSMFEKF